MCELTDGGDPSEYQFTEYSFWNNSTVEIQFLCVHTLHQPLNNDEIGVELQSALSTPIVSWGVRQPQTPQFHSAPQGMRRVSRRESPHQKRLINQTLICYPNKYQESVESDWR